MEDRPRELKKHSLTYKDIPLLMHLSEEEVQRMHLPFRVYQMKKGMRIFSAGDPADTMYILYKGQMKISMILPDGKEQLLYLYREGDFVGGLNLLSGDHYVYNGESLTDGVVISIDVRDFHDVLLNNKSFLIKMLEKSYERIRKSEQLIKVLSGGNAEGKVAKVLLHLMEAYGKEVKGSTVIDLKINREEMGSFSGISRETMSRKLRAFEDEGILEILTRGKIRILNREELERIGEGVEEN